MRLVAQGGGGCQVNLRGYRWRGFPLHIWTQNDPRGLSLGAPLPQGFLKKTYSPCPARFDGVSECFPLPCSDNQGEGTGVDIFLNSLGVSPTTVLGIFINDAQFSVVGIRWPIPFFEVPLRTIFSAGWANPPG